MLILCSQNRKSVIQSITYALFFSSLVIDLQILRVLSVWLCGCAVVHLEFLVSVLLCVNAVQDLSRLCKFPRYAENGKLSWHGTCRGVRQRGPALCGSECLDLIYTSCNLTQVMEQ